MIDEEKLHDALSRLLREVGVRLDAPALHDRHRAGGDRLGRLLDLYETHPAVASDGQTLVVAETRNFHADHGCGLKKNVLQLLFMTIFH